MGSAEAIGYEVEPCNLVQRGMQRVASSKPGAWALSKILHHADRRLFAWSKGRITVPGMVAGLPVLMVTTTGAKSGQARTMPLLGFTAAAQVYPGYDKYRRRIAERPIRVFVLQPDEQ
jgi:hypothetical protein